MPDFEVDVTAYPVEYPPGLTENECAAMDHDFDVLVIAVDKDDATEKAIEHLFAMLQGKIEYKFTPATVRGLEPGEAPMWGSVDYDFRDIKTPFTRQNREAEIISKHAAATGFGISRWRGP